jgi:hypothetical protein
VTNRGSRQTCKQNNSCDSKKGHISLEMIYGMGGDGGTIVCFSFLQENNIVAAMRSNKHLWRMVFI